MDSTYNTDESWIDMGRAIKLTKRIQQFRIKYGIMNPDHMYAPLLHSLTKPNIKKKNNW